MALGDFYTAAQSSLSAAEDFARKHALVGRIVADHICYKCSSSQSFEERRAALEHESEYIHQSIISGRRIAYIKFKKLVESLLGPVHFLELSDQKPDGSQVEGFDHVEVYPTAFSYDEFVLKLEQAGERVQKIVRPHHTTHDVELWNGFVFRLCSEPLIEKIKRDEMV